MDDLTDLFDNAPCGNVVLSPDGWILRANATLARWLASVGTELEGRPFRDILTFPGRIFFETNFRPQLRLSAEIEEVSLDLLSTRGNPVPVLVSAREIRNPAGDCVAIQMVLTRAGGRRDMERSLRRSEADAAAALAAANEIAKFREQFIAVLGHDLRNPLASVIGASRLLRKEALSDKAGRILDLMEGSVVRMAGLIDNVMDFARGRLGGGIGLSASVQPLEPTLRQVVDEFETIHPGREIVSAFEVPHPILHDRDRIGQLLSNLLGNAFTHGDPLQPIRVAAVVQDDRLRLFVSNGGAQISDAAMSRLFQPFVRGEARTNQEGLGLGLHIASEIARAHGGTLSASSTPEATIFLLDIPTREG